MAYGTDADFQAWLDANGLTLPASAPSLAVLRQGGSSYLDATYGARLYCSQPTGGFAQVEAWPRTGHTVNGIPVPDDLIPIAWVNASYRAAWLKGNGTSLSSTVNPTGRVKMQKVDTIQREFFDGGTVEAGSGSGAVIDAEIDGLVTPFLCPAANEKGLGFWVIGC